MRTVEMAGKKHGTRVIHKINLEKPEIWVLNCVANDQKHAIQVGLNW